MKKGGFRRWARYQYIKLVRLDDSPEKIARGFAFGVVLGILPTFGLGAIAAVIFAGFLRINKASAVIGTFIMNPWTAPFFWALSYMAGSLIMGNHLQETVSLVKNLKSHRDLWENILAHRLLIPYMIGNVIITAASAATSYAGCLYVVRTYKKTRARKNRNNRKNN